MPAISSEGGDLIPAGKAECGLRCRLPIHSGAIRARQGRDGSGREGGGVEGRDSRRARSGKKGQGKDGGSVEMEVNKERRENKGMVAK